MVWVITAAEAAEKYAADECTCCGRTLTGKVRMLELDHRTGTYHDRGDVPADKSQGWHAFGSTCARKIIVKSWVS